MTRLDQSIDSASALLGRADLSTDTAVAELLGITAERRRLDLSDMAPYDQAAMIASRSKELQPGPQELTSRIEGARKAGRPFRAKFGIDPTGAEVHLGHVVPMLILSRLQRMGHEIVFIVGDITAKIGDPSGRSDERPPLTDADIGANLSTYRDQVAPFFDFSAADFRHNGEWLSGVTLPRLIEISSRIPISMPLQRDDFRKRLDAGHGLSLAEVLYSVAMALDSVEIETDLEVGGVDQFLNMQMCRHVMQICGQAPEVVVATHLIEGTDGSGTKMSKSQGNYVPLTASPTEIFGKLMSVPDRLVEPYLAALSEWTDAEIALASSRVAEGSLHPMDFKRILAGEVTAALHGPEASSIARREFASRFSKRSFQDVDDLPVVTNLGPTLAEVVRSLGFAKSNGEVRRIAEQNGLRLIVEATSGQEHVSLGPEESHEPLGALVEDKLKDRQGTVYLKVGRKLARLAPPGR